MTIDAGGEAATTAAPEQQERDYEAEASKQGWRPQDEWTGAPEHWKDAQTWVENGDTKARIAKVEKNAEVRFSRLEKATSKATAALIASYEKQIDDLKAEKKTAIKAGDENRVEAIDAKIDDLKEKTADKVEKTAATDGDDFVPKAGSTEHVKLVEAFTKSNPWMIEEPDMAEYAERFSERNAAANDGIGFGANMKATIAAVRKKFPAYFADMPEEKPAANGHAAVDAGGSFSGSTRNTRKTFSDLPKEAQTTYERFDPKIKAVLSKEKYTKEYYDA